MLDTKRERKDNTLMVRVTTKEKNIIKALAVANGQSISEFFLERLYKNLSDKEKNLIKILEQQEGL